MARMIDADVAIKRFRGWLEGPHEASEYNSGFDDAIYRVLDVIDHMPTLTQPNELLTLEELKEMRGRPVWIDELYVWGLVEVIQENIFLVTINGVYNAEQYKVYRRPPEGEA